MKDKKPFFDKKLRNTDDIEELRLHYEDLLVEYQKEMKKRIHLEMKEYRDNLKSEGSKERSVV